jgi:hypothetical protein
MTNDQKSLWDALFGPTPSAAALYGHTVTQTCAASPQSRAPTLADMKAAADRLALLNLWQTEPIELTQAQLDALKEQCKTHGSYPADKGAPSQLFGLRIVLKDG